MTRKEQIDMIKKAILWALLPCLAAAFFPVTGQATSETRKMMTLSGSVVAGETKAVLAPFGGTLSQVSLSAGDFVGAGDTLFSLDTTRVYAPCDGVVGSLGIGPGDDVAFIQERYGALLYIEPSSRFIIQTDTKYAYNASDNAIVHVGEAVYIGSRTSSERLGEGFVTKVEGEAYTVEVTGGTLILGDSVSLFRSHDLLADTKIGSGTTELNANVAVTSEGSVFKLHVAQGDAVRRGDVLLETVSGTLEYNAYPTNRVQSGYDAIVATVDISAGAMIEKNQVMATLYPIESLQVAVNINEADLKNVSLGDAVQVEIVGLRDNTPVQGSVVSISGLGVVAETGEVTYAVRVGFEATQAVRIDMSANVYFNQ